MLMNIPSYGNFIDKEFPEESFPEYIHLHEEDQRKLLLELEDFAKEA
jgi:hypothetical protein